MAIMIAVVVSFAFGCGRSKTSECAVASEMINRGTPRLDFMRRIDEKTSARRVLDVADELDKLASDVAATPLLIPELASSSHDYQELVKQVASAARADAEKGAPSSVPAAVEDDLERERPIVDKVLRYCFAR